MISLGTNGVQFTKSLETSTASETSAAALKWGKLKLNQPFVTAMTGTPGSAILGSSPIAYSKRLGRLSPSGLAASPLIAGLFVSAAENLAAFQALKVVFTVTITELLAVLLLAPVTVTRAV